MAQTIPETLPDQATMGEQRLFAILKRLPGNVVVYYEPVIANRYPDFVLILPTLGVLIIEVKGWYLKEIMAANSESVHLCQNQREVLKAHPLAQVRRYKFALMDRCREDPQSADLVNNAGAYLGNFKFPFGSFAILSNISQAQMNAMPGNEAVFPPNRVATRDQLEAWASLSPSAFLKILYGFFDPAWKIAPMTANQVNIIKAILHPEILLRLDPAKYGEKEALKVRVLDLKQEAIARNIGTGHRLVFGVAGSGKTVVLVARVKLVHRLRPSARILVLCFNIPLSAMLTDLLKSCASNVSVFHFDGWARANGVARDFDQNEQDASLGKRLLAALKAGALHTGKFDVILIDEAQDFSPEWYHCVLKALKDPVNGDLLIVGDGNQGVYDRRKISWKQLGIQAKGRTRYLHHNYRNTRPILELASLFADRDSAANEDTLRSLHVNPRNAVRVSGLKPVLLKSKDELEEMLKTVQVVHDLTRGRWFGQDIAPVRPGRIAILYRHVNKEDRGNIDEFRTHLDRTGTGIPSLWLSENPQSKRRVSEPAVKIMTMHAAKGLQFRAVILFAGHDCPAKFSNTDEAEERSLFYVALTRPEDYLVISTSGTSAYMTKIETLRVAEVRH